MTASVLNRALTPLAKALEHDDMQRLGIDRTTAIARWWNRGRKPLLELRRHMYENRFDELLDENGWPNGELRLRLEDGFALDQSHSLPYLDALIEEMDEV